MVYDHLGNSFKTLKELLAAHNISQSAYYKRRSRGMTLQEILDKEILDRHVVDHLGNTYESLIKMCEHYNIKKDTYKHRLKIGLSVEEALTLEKRKVRRKKTIEDHKGNKFETIIDMCKYWGISVDLYRSRRAYGWSLRDALEVHDKLRKESVDHLGNKYKSIDDMCRYWGIKPSTYQSRIRYGYTLQEALETPVIVRDKNKVINKIEKPKKVTSDIVYDHLGKEFNTSKEMCEYWGISVGAYKSRIKRGWSVKDALTKPIIPKDGAVDHKGNKFKSKAAMCTYWGTSPQTLKNKLEDGYTLEEILENNTKYIEPVDHNNIRYNTVKEMCSHYNISTTTLRSRLYLGLSLKDALTIPTKIYKNKVDHTGKEFRSKKEMCRYWGINETTFTNRMESGKFTLEEALTIKPKHKRIEIIDPKGIKYKSFRKMCEAYNMSPCVVRQRLSKGMELQDALKIYTPINGFNINAFGRQYTSISSIIKDYPYMKFNTLSIRLDTTKRHLVYDIELIVGINSLRNIRFVSVGIDGQARYKVPWHKDYQTTREIIAYKRPDLLTLYDKSHPNGKWNPYKQFNKTENIQ